MDETARRTGVWLVGARGSVATTAVIGAAAARAGLASLTGCVTDLPRFPDAGLPAFSGLVFGGHDVVETPLPKRAEQLAGAGVLPAHLPSLVHDDLLAVEAEIRPGVPASGAGRDQSEAVASVAQDLASFQARHRLARVVVVNVASTEPPLRPRYEYASLETLEDALTAGVLPPSSLYAYAALRARCPYVDFTPSAGGRIPALQELAHAQGVPYAGSDAKTGETLVKSVLAPMFAARALRVRSWSGTNLLGGGDGATLADPAAAASKTTSKQRAIGEALGYPVDGEVHIDYVPDLGEWKTAWDHITFEGFLGVRMTMQFTWQGCDSALAAPLVLDLARLVARADEAGLAGPLAPLAFFFKDPVATTEHALAAQYDTLVRWASGLGTRP
ncbi:MAG: inositol-3-phosphate synthase [Actinomycetes bacterium]